MFHSIVFSVITFFAQTVPSNCPPGASSGPNCFTNLPTPNADGGALRIITNLVIGVMAAIAVLIIVIQGIKYTLSSGEPDKTAAARKGIIYALVGLVVTLSAEAIVNLVIWKL